MSSNRCRNWSLRGVSIYSVLLLDLTEQKCLHSREALMEHMHATVCLRRPRTERPRKGRVICLRPGPTDPATLHNRLQNKSTAYSLPRTQGEKPRASNRHV